MSKKLLCLIPLSDENLHLNQEEKVIPKEDFSKIISSSELVNQVQEDSKKYKQSVAEECEKLKETAQNKGFEEGLLKWNHHLVQLENEIETVRSEMEKLIVDLALKAAKKIVGKELEQNPDIIVEIVSKTLKSVTQHQNISIFVHPSAVANLEKKRLDLKQIIENAKSFSIEEKSDIKPGGCIIETEAGIINAEIEHQWQALETAFRSLMKNQSN